MDDFRMPASESPLGTIFAVFSDPVGLLLVMMTVVGFTLPMLWIYPPVAPRPSDFLNETHSKLGLERGGKAGDQAGPRVKGAKATAAPRLKDINGRGAAPARIDRLWVYPVKSCAGIQVSRSRILSTGPEFDRLFTFAQLLSPFPARAGDVVATVSEDGTKKQDAEDDYRSATSWDAISQRQFPLLASLEVELWRPDLEKVRRAQARMRIDDQAERSASMNELYVVVRYPWQEPGWMGRWDWFAAKLARGWRAVPEVEVVLPLALPDEVNTKEQAAAKHSHVYVAENRIRAWDLSAELPRSLQLYLGVSNRLGLLRFDPAAAPDQHHVHLLSRESERALEAVVPTGSSRPQLRANIVGMYFP